jgi:hypothetical protein
MRQSDAYRVRLAPSSFMELGFNHNSLVYVHKFFATASADIFNRPPWTKIRKSRLSTAFRQIFAEFDDMNDLLDLCLEYL